MVAVKLKFEPEIWRMVQALAEVTGKPPRVLMVELLRDLLLDDAISHGLSPDTLDTLH